MSLHDIPWKSCTYSPWPSRQQPCNSWALLCSQFPTRWMHLCWWHIVDQRLCRKEEKAVAVSYLYFCLIQFTDQYTKTDHTVPKRGEKKNEEWCSTKKHGLLMGDQEDILRRKQLSTTALHNLNNIWTRKSNKRTYSVTTLQNFSQTSAYVQQPNMGPNSEWWR